MRGEGIIFWQNKDSCAVITVNSIVSKSFTHFVCPRFASTIMEKTQIVDFTENLNPFALESPQCFGENSCDEHEHTLRWVCTSNLEPSSIRAIWLKILLCARDAKGPVIPNEENSKVSCNGKHCSIEWEPFQWGVFNNPAPTTALQATLASVLCSMYCNTDTRCGRLGYGKHALASRLVFSRSDIVSKFKEVREESFEDMCKGIESIRLQDFALERTKWKELEAKHPYQELWSAIED